MTNPSEQSIEQAIDEIIYRDFLDYVYVDLKDAASSDGVELLAKAIKRLVDKATREARLDEVKRFREAMTFEHMTPSIYSEQRGEELSNKEGE